MASLLSERLLNSKIKASQRKEVPCNASPLAQYRNLFGQSSTNDRAAQSMTRNYGTGEFTTEPLVNSMPPSLYVTDRGGVDDSSGVCVTRRLKVVKESDNHRGFRMFDGMLMSVKDVSSEELFLERMKVAYSAYEACVANLIEKSPMEITRGMVRAVSRCLELYFSTQSMLRTNRPFIVKVLNLDNADLFCAHSDLMKSFLFTNASPEDEAVISNAEAVYSHNVSGVVDVGNNVDNQQHTNGISEEERTFDNMVRLTERSVLGGTNASLGGGQGFSYDSSTSSHRLLSDELLFQQRKDGTGRTLDGGTTAMLVVITDFEALHNFIAYLLYLTPTQLTRRYNVNFDSMQRPVMSTTTPLDICRSRRAAAKKHKGDDAKTSIRSVLERKRLEKMAAVVDREALLDAGQKIRNQQMVQRSNELLRHLLLLLFDKCLTGLIDKGFENLNARRGYAVKSSKEIGAATIYTGIIDTVGEVTTRVEGYTFENMMRSATATPGSEADGSNDVDGDIGIVGQKQRKRGRNSCNCEDNQVEESN